MKKNNKNAFTIIEVSILFVIFLIVALLVAPLSLDDTLQAKNTSRWKQVQSEFANIFHSIDMQKTNDEYDFRSIFNEIISKDIKNEIIPYRIKFQNNKSQPNNMYKFDTFYNTHKNATLAFKLFDNPQNNIIGTIIYDVNGQTGPNTWGKDVFGYNITYDGFEPLGKNQPQNVQKKDCSKDGTGVYCSNYYLIGGNFD